MQKALGQAAFEGLPLVRSEPQTPQDAHEVFRTTHFPDVKQILNFFEKNRYNFETLFHFHALFHKLRNTMMKGHKKGQSGGSFQSAQLKMAVNDFSKILAAEEDKLDMMVEILEDLVTCYRIVGTDTLPKPVRKLYFNLFEDMDRISLRRWIRIAGRINTGHQALGIDKGQADRNLAKIEEWILTT